MVPEPVADIVLDPSTTVITLVPEPVASIEFVPFATSNSLFPLIASILLKPSEWIVLLTPAEVPFAIIKLNPVTLALPDVIVVPPAPLVIVFVLLVDPETRLPEMVAVPLTLRDPPVTTNPPTIVVSEIVEAPPIRRVPPANKLPQIPTPPLTTSDPDAVELDSVVPTIRVISFLVPSTIVFDADMLAPKPIAVEPVCVAAVSVVDAPRNVLFAPDTVVVPIFPALFPIPVLFIPVVYCRALSPTAVELFAPDVLAIALFPIAVTLLPPFTPLYAFAPTTVLLEPGKKDIALVPIAVFRDPPTAELEPPKNEPIVPCPTATLSLPAAMSEDEP